MKSFNKIYFGSILFLVPFVAAAQLPGGTNNGGLPGGTNNSVVGIANPLNPSAGSVCGALKLFLNALLVLGIPVAVLFLVYAGFLFVWARGSKDGLAKAKSNFFYAIIGIAIFMGAWTLGQIIANTLGTLSTQAGQPNAQIGSCIGS